MSKMYLVTIGIILCFYGVIMNAPGQVCTCLSLAGLVFFVGDAIYTTRGLLTNNVMLVILKYLGIALYTFSAAIALLALFPESELFRACMDIFGNVAEFCSIERAAIDSKIPIISLGVTMIYIAFRVMIAERDRGN